MGHLVGLSSFCLYCPLCAKLTGGDNSFTYATMFALESLALNHETFDNSLRVRKACDFLLRRQMGDGGWGESYRVRPQCWSSKGRRMLRLVSAQACETGRYVHHVKSQVVNTAWAVLALLAAKCPDHDAIVNGCRLIMSRQRPDGRWEQEAIEGIFNKSTAISYPNYKLVWTAWALGKAHQQLPDVKW